MNGLKNRFMKGEVGYITLLLMLGSAQMGLTQPVMLVKDINPGVGNSDPREFTSFNGDCIFTAASGGGVGNEVWKSDGTVNGTVLVKDIATRPGGSQPNGYTVVNNTVFFSAVDDILGEELFKTDGTTAGTILVKDIWPGGASRPGEFIDFDGSAIFHANDGTHGVELWKSDGTAAGTVMVKDISATGDSNPREFRHFNGEIYFRTAYPLPPNPPIIGEIWKTDGTAAGTVAVTDTINPNGLTVVGNLLFFSAASPGGRELWKSDGTTAGTVLLKDINPTSSSSPEFLIEANGTLFFTADDGVHGRELWKSDGTAAGTVLVKDIHPGTGNEADIQELANVNGTLFFNADDGTSGAELWKSDGTTAGTVLVKDIFPGSAGSDPNWLANLQGTLFCSAENGTHGIELWRSDGTSAGTQMVEDINPAGSSTPLFLADIGGTLFFQAEDELLGGELWVTRSPIDFTFEPVNPPVVIPPSGGSFQFDVNIANVSGKTESLEFWTSVTLANGSSTDPLFGPASLELAPGQIIATTLTQNVPAVDPATFTYVGNLGFFPDSVRFSDSFTFTVTSNPNLAKASQSESTGDWSGYKTGMQPQNLASRVPEEFTLEQNYPNPFNPTTTISYQLPQAESVKITIYDLTGRLVTELLNETQSAGSHQVQWNGKNDRNQQVASGLYLYRIQAGEFKQTRKMAFIR